MATARTTTKKTATKKIAAKAAPKSTKKAVTKKPVAAKKPVAKKPAAKKPVAKKPAIKKLTAKKPVAKKVAPLKAGRAVEAKATPKKLKDAGNKTVATKESIDSFLKRVPADQLADTKTLIAMMQKVTGDPPEMWGPSIVGFGNRTLTYETGRTMEWMVTAFSPRKQNLTVYVVDDSPRCAELLSKLGKHTSSKVCLYIKRLSDVNLDVLNDLIVHSVEQTRAFDRANPKG